MSDVRFNAIRFNVWQRGGAVQLEIGDDHGGYRIGGPKFAGNSKLVASFPIKPYMLDGIMPYLYLVVAEREEMEREAADEDGA